MLNLPWQDELLEHSEAAEDMMAKKLDLLEEWLEDTNSKKLVMSNKLITRYSVCWLYWCKSNEQQAHHLVLSLLALLVQKCTY